MRQEIILGTPPTGLGGDTPRACSMKINAMTLELYGENAKFNTAIQDLSSGKAARGANSDITSLTGLSTPLSVSQGGAGGTAIVQASTVDANSLTASAYAYAFRDGGVNLPTSGQAYYVRVTRHADLVMQEAFGMASVIRNFTRLFNGTTWDAWVPRAAGGANSDITSLSGLTTALSVSQGGTGGKTQADARTGLGLGTAATLTAGSASGNAMLAGDRASPLASTINTWGNSYQIWTSSGTLGAPEAGSFGTIINAAWPSGTYGAQILMSVTGRMFFRAGDYSSASMREVYHTGNTTRAADGTLKAI